MTINTCQCHPKRDRNLAKLSFRSETKESAFYRDFPLHCFQPNMPIETENLGGTLYINIRPRITWRLVIITLLLVFWGWSVLFSFYSHFTDQQNAPFDLKTGLFALLGPIVFCSILYSFLWAIFGYNRVRVTESQLQIESVLFGFTYAQKKFENQSVNKLRYEEWYAGRSGKLNGIRFDYDGKLITFACQAKKQDCNDCIDRLTEIYKFDIPAPTTFPGVVDWSK
jgi:hypothetical protein